MTIREGRTSPSSVGSPSESVCLTLLSVATLHSRVIRGDHESLSLIEASGRAGALCALLAIVGGGGGGGAAQKS